MKILAYNELVQDTRTCETYRIISVTATGETITLKALDIETRPNTKLVDITTLRRYFNAMN